MMQYGNVDVTLDIIRGIDAIRRGESVKVDVSMF